MKKQQEEQDIKDNIISLDEVRLKMAAKEPPKGGNWLSNLEKGTRFLCSRRQTNDPVLGDFLVGSDPKAMSAVFLGYELNHRDGGFKFFDPVKFCQIYDLFMILEVEIENGSPEIRTGTVESDGDDQIIHRDDEEREH